MLERLVSALPWHDAQWVQVEAWLAQQRMPHAILLQGPAGVGKTRFAERLAQGMLCESEGAAPCGHCRSCDLLRAETHPNLRLITPEESGKAIKIDAVRALIQQSVLTTQGEGARVFVLAPAEAMNHAAANALLKTLEEPAGNNRLVLVSSQPQRLPATIRSRCQQMTFNPVPDEIAEPWLKAELPDAELAPLLAISAGAPLRAIQIAQASGLETARETLEDLLALKQRKVNPLGVVQAWTDRPLPTLLAEIGMAMSDITQLLAQQAAPRLFLPACTSQLQSLSSNLDLSAVFQFIDSLNQRRQKLHHNLNSQMLLEALVNDWLALTRKVAR